MPYWMPRNNAISLQTAGQTDRGHVRDHNEDYIFFDPLLGLAVLADGMGGYNAGEIASEIAAQTIAKGVRRAFEKGEVPYLNGAADPEDGLMYATTLLRKQVILANRKVYEASINEPDCEGMGTTVVAAILCAHRFTVAHVGDSRAYRWRNGVFCQLTRDHSLLQEQIDHAEWQAERADEFPRKNLVTRALGADRHVQVDIAEFDALPDDVFLLCSDGLTDMLSPSKISGIIDETHSVSLDNAAVRLVEEANKQGGRDNVSVVLLRIPKS